MLCLQETKVENGKFPQEIAEELGYAHRLIHGQKAYHGVAILSRLPFARTETRDWADKDHARHAYVTIEVPGGAPLEVHSFYVPSGGDEPNPKVNDKFAHKLAFLEEMAAWFAERHNPSNRLVLVGDEHTANLPWEMMQADEKPTGRRTAIIRQLVSPSARRGRQRRAERRR